MTTTISGSLRLRISHPGSLSFRGAGIETSLGQTWFYLGFKRTTGAPATVADLVDKRVGRVIDFDRGSYAWADTATATASVALGPASDEFPSALAGDHMYLLVAHTAAGEPAGDVTFDAVKAVGALQA